MNEKQQRDLERTKLRNKRARILILILGLFGLGGVLYAGTKLTMAAVASQAARLVCSEESAAKDTLLIEIGAQTADLEKWLAIQTDWIRQLTADSVLTATQVTGLEDENQSLRNLLNEREARIVWLNRRNTEVTLMASRESHDAARLRVENDRLQNLPVDTVVITQTETVQLPPETITIEVRRDDWLPTKKGWLEIMLAGGFGFVIRSLFESDDHKTVVVER